MKIIPNRWEKLDFPCHGRRGWGKNSQIRNTKTRFDVVIFIIEKYDRSHFPLTGTHAKFRPKNIEILFDIVISKRYNRRPRALTLSQKKKKGRLANLKNREFDLLAPTQN